MDENMRVLPVRKDGKFCYNIILKADFTKLGEPGKDPGSGRSEALYRGGREGRRALWGSGAG